jgi:hypothetical protein
MMLALLIDHLGQSQDLAARGAEDASIRSRDRGGQGAFSASLFRQGHRRPAIPSRLSAPSMKSPRAP